MAKIEDISWGSYNEYEGPFYRGKTKFTLPSNPTNTDKCLAAITAIESGHYDAINMYDRMIISIGLIQWGEANTLSVSKFLGSLADLGLESVIQQCLKPALEISGATFKKNVKGNWRFFIADAEVNSLALQQKLFLNCDGRKGSWTDESKLHAKTWAAAMATLLENPKVCEVQKKFTMNRLIGFVMTEARKELFDDKTSSPWAEAIRAIYLTFAINLPAIAGKMFIQTNFSGEKWSPEWCISLTKKLTFGPAIKIYPMRYNALRPTIEKLFQVELPKNAVELENWVPPLKEMKSVQTLPVVSLQPEVESSQPVATEKKVEEQIVQKVEQPNGFFALLQKLFSLLFGSK